MNQEPVLRDDLRMRAQVDDAFSQSSSAVSWAAIVAGAVAAAALSLILLILGTGLGLSSVSPFSGRGAEAATFGVSTILWLTFTQLAASGMGGYLAGRLRSRWLSTHVDEVYFRDTAHGFLAWALASLATAALLTSVIGSILNGGVQAGASGVASAVTMSTAAVSTGAATARDGSAERVGYFVDSLFRKDAAAADQGASTPAQSDAGADGTASGRSSAEVTRIFASATRDGTLPPEDSKYLGQVIAQRTGLSQADAEKRVTDTFARMQAKLKDAEAAAREKADQARRASSYAALWLFVSLLVGAFIASLAATYGGRRRDL
ncbi:MAG: hypothetical protein ABI460_07125 [Caldimonas sp.]